MNSTKVQGHGGLLYFIGVYTKPLTSIYMYASHLTYSIASGTGSKAR